jgi:hypothetical protein
MMTIEERARMGNPMTVGAKGTLAKLKAAAELAAMTPGDAAAAGHSWADRETATKLLVEFGPRLIDLVESQTARADRNCKYFWEQFDETEKLDQEIKRLRERDKKHRRQIGDLYLKHNEGRAEHERMFKTIVDLWETGRINANVSRAILGYPPLESAGLLEMSIASGSAPAELQALWDKQAAWSNRAFGDEAERGPVGPLKHLVLEAGEAMENPEDPEEFADCSNLAMDAARRAGHSCATWWAACVRKQSKCETRTYPKPTSDEPSQHVREVDVDALIAADIAKNIKQVTEGKWTHRPKGPLSVKNLSLDTHLEDRRPGGGSDA